MEPTQLCRLLQKLVVLLSVLLVSVAAGAVYEMSVVQQSSTFAFAFVQFATTDKLACFNACSGNVSAASFSKFLNLCMLNTCANIRLLANAMWTTFVCVTPVVVGCDYPTPTLEWMMTDACGFANTGSLNPGWLMYQAANMAPASWPYMFTDWTNTGLFGRAVRYPNAPNYQSITVPGQLTLDPRQSLTFSGYIKLYLTGVWFPIIELGNIQSDGSYYMFGLNLWIFNGGVFSYFNAPEVGCSGVCVPFWTYNPPLNKWIHIAVVYDGSIKKFQVFINGTSVWTSQQALFTGALTRSVVVTGSRPQGQGGQLPGSTFCLRIFRAALTQSQVQAVAQSCLSGAITFQ